MQHITSDRSAACRSGDLVVLIHVVLVAICIGVGNILLDAVFHHNDHVGHGGRRTTKIDRVDTRIGIAAFQRAIDNVGAEAILKGVRVTMCTHITSDIAGLVKFQNIGHTNILNRGHQNVEFGHTRSLYGVIHVLVGIVDDLNRRIGEAVRISLVKNNHVFHLLSF